LSPTGTSEYHLFPLTVNSGYGSWI